MMTADDRRIRTVDCALEAVARGIWHGIAARHPGMSVDEIMATCPSLKHYQRDLFRAASDDPSTMLVAAIDKAEELGVEKSELHCLREFRNAVVHKKGNAAARTVALDEGRVRQELSRGAAVLERLGCVSGSTQIRRYLAYYLDGAPEGTWRAADDDVIEAVASAPPPTKPASKKARARRPRLIASAAGLSPDQEEAIRRVRAWWERGGPRFVISGPAGTGKTRLIPAIIADLGLPPEVVRMIAPTNKAVEVLKGKLPDRLGFRKRVSTLHSLLYQYQIPPSEDGEDLQFKVIGQKPADSTVRLLICDEASMLTSADVASLERYRTIYLGDAAQLPPVIVERVQNGVPVTASTVLQQPDAELTTIHRQDGGSILEVAETLRQGESLSPAVYDDGRTQILDESQGHLDRRELRRFLKDADAVLVARNVTRIRVNEIIRELRGFLRHPGDWVPKPGEVLVATDKLSGTRAPFEGQPDLANGQQLVVDEVLKVGAFVNRTTKQEVLGIWVRAHFLDNPSVSGIWPISQEMLVGRHVVGDEVSTRYVAGPRSGLLRCDWGYALTVHKSQGSEWRRVLVVDHGSYDRLGQREWNYVAVTRARESVTVVRLKPDSALLS